MRRLLAGLVADGLLDLLDAMKIDRQFTAAVPAVDLSTQVRPSSCEETSHVQRSIEELS